MSRRVDPYNHVLRIIQCTLPWCFTWYIGDPHNYYCPEHAHYRRRSLDHARKGKISKLTREEVMEIRWKYLRMPVAAIAREHNISTGRVYWLQKNFPQNMRGE